MTSSGKDAIEEVRALLEEYEQFLSGKAQGTTDAYLRTVRHPLALPFDVALVAKQLL